MLLLWDRNFLSHARVQQVIRSGAQLLARVKSDLIFQPIRRLSDGSYLAKLYKSATHRTPTATITLKDSNGEPIQDASIGDGPVDAIYSAIQRLTGVRVSLSDYRIRAVTKGKEALGEVQIEIDHSGKKVRGRGLSTDILEASALAYLAAINRLRSMTVREKLVTQHNGV